MKKLPVGPAEIAVLVSLPGVWTRAGVEAAFARAGWSGESVEWAGGAGSPHFFGEEDNGWRLELGDEPGSPTAAVRLPCALFWPALDVDDEDPDLYDEADLDEEDDLDDEYADVWTRDPDADRDAFDQEFERLSDLLRAELGEPVKRTEGVLPQETWQRDGFEVALEMTDDINSYSHYDVIAVIVRPT
jgi:hypothetical protein